MKKDLIRQISSIKLVRASEFRDDAFAGISAKAKKIINSAKDDQILALALSTKVTSAKIFDRKVFDAILARGNIEIKKEVESAARKVKP